MKVICIDTSRHVAPTVIKLVEGNVYETLDTMDFGYAVGYKIQGYEKTTDGTNAWYDVKDFVPCSTIDETELLKEREEVFAT